MNETIDKNVDLVYSPDEGFYYLQRYDTNETSQPMKSKTVLLKAYRNAEIDWQE
jgi:hypothetical protein